MCFSLKKLLTSAFISIIKGFFDVTGTSDKLNLYKLCFKSINGGIWSNILSSSKCCNYQTNITHYLK